MSVTSPPETARAARWGLPWKWVLAVLAAHLLLLARTTDPTPARAALPAPAQALQTRHLIVPTPPASPAPSPIPAAAPAPARVRAASPPAQPSTAASTGDAAAPTLAPADEPVPESTAPPPPAASGDDSSLVIPSPADPPPPAATAGAGEDTTTAQATPAAQPAATGVPVVTAGPPLPHRLPPPTQLQYRVFAEARGVAQTASGQLDWEHDGQGYRLTLELRALFVSRRQTSEGLIGPRGLAPRRFGERTRSERAAHFEPEAGRVRFSANTPDAPWQPDMQDRLSLFLQLAARLNASPEDFAPGSRLSLPTVSSREAEPWVLEVVGDDTLALPLGTLQAVHLRRLPRRPHDQMVDIWFAPSLDHLPVRLRLQEANGNVADLQLSGRRE